MNLPPTLDHLGQEILASLSLSPTLDHLGWEILASSGGELAGVARCPMKRRRHVVADRAVRSDLIVVSTPSLAFSPRFVEAQEPVGIAAFGAELAVQAFDESVVGWLAGSAEVERHIVQEGPEVELPADELGTVIETNGLGIANLVHCLLKRGDDIGTAVGLAHVDRRRQPREGVDDGQHADLATIEKLVMHEVHRPDLVGFGC